MIPHQSRGSTRILEVWKALSLKGEFYYPISYIQFYFFSEQKDEQAGAYI